MIYGFFIQNRQECNTLRTDVQPHHYFLWEISCLLNAISFIHISTIYCLHSSLLSIADSINIKRTFHPKREFSRCLLFENTFAISSRTFSVCFFHYRKVMTRLRFCKVLIPNRFLIFV